MPRKNPKPATNTCAYCGKATANPKYCSHSCSARATQPPKPPSCRQCGKPAKAGDKICEECQAKEQAAKERKTQNIQEILTLSGQRVDFKASHALARKTIVFELGAGHRLPLTPGNTCGEFLDDLISLMLSGPEYILSEHVYLFIAFLHDLAESRCQRRGRHGEVMPDSEPVRSMPILELGWAVESWLRAMMSSEDRDWYRVTYGLVTAELIELHAMGELQYGHVHWRVTPMIDIPDTGYGLPMFHFLDKQFKKAITEAIRNQVVWFQVPNDFKLVDAYGQELTIPEDRNLLLRIRRCHLSEGPTTELVARFEGPIPRGLRFADDIRLPGDLLNNARPETLEALQLYLSGQAIGTPTNVPAGWVRQTVRIARSTGTIQLDPVPTWL